MRFGRRRYKIIHTVHAVYRYKLYNYGTKESDRGGGAHAVGELKHLCRVETIETIVFAVVARGSTCISLETVTKGVKHHPEYCFADFQEISEKKVLGEKKVLVTASLVVGGPASDADHISTNLRP